jgi:parvulin-like peptidyl-prolyl isomerase
MQIKYNDMAGTSDDPQAFRSAFFEITREFSRDDSELVRRGGDLGWVPQGIYKDFDHVIFDLEPGNLSEPVRNPDVPQQLFVFMVAEKSDARQLSDFNRDALKTEAMQNWLNEERRDKDVYAVFNSDIYNWMVEQLGLSASITPTPPPNPFQSLGAN